MQILWNTLLISLGLLLPTSSSIVLAQSLKTAKFDTPTPSTSEFRPISNSATTLIHGDLPEASSAFEVIPVTRNETIEEPIAIASADTVIAEQASPAQPPPTIVVPVIPATTRETPTQTEVPNNPPTTTAPSSHDSPSDSEKPPQTEGAENKPSSSDSTDAKEPELSPEELARQQKLIQADQLFMSGQLTAAQQLYREAKTPFETEVQSQVKAQPKPIYDSTQLPAAGSVYWRMSGEGLEQKLQTKIFVPLESLVEQFPEFIPGHLRYAQALKEYNQPEKALQVLERARSLYPREPELLKATLAAMGEQKKWLEASLAARQFALLYPDHPQSSEFSKLADENLERYRKHVRRELRGNAIANAITGTLGLVFTGNLFGLISAIDSTVMLLRGESAVGESVANKVKRQVPMTDDEAVLNYVREVGNKVALVA